MKSSRLTSAMDEGPHRPHVEPAFRNTIRGCPREETMVACRERTAGMDERSAWNAFTIGWGCVAASVQAVMREETVSCEALL